MRLAQQICAQGNDVAITSFLENLLMRQKKSIWFLFETDAN
jgi:hypothetical protein